MKIKTKLFLLLLVIGVIPTFIVGYSVYKISHDSWEYDKLNDLMDVVDAKYIHILDFLHMKKADINAMGRGENLHQVLQDYYAGIKSEEQIEHLNRILTDIQANSILEEHIQKKEKEAGTDLLEVFGRPVKWDIYRLDERISRYDELLMLDSEGKVIASSREESIGLDLSNDEFFTRGKEEVFIKDVYEDYTGKVVFGFAAPVTEKHAITHEPREKQFLGVIVLKIPIEYLNDIVTGDVGNQVGGKLFFAGIGLTEDYYIVRSDGMMMTHPRSLIGKENVILKKKVDTVSVQRCLIGGEIVDDKVITKPGGQVREAQEIAVNYEGVPVGVASMCIFEMNWTIIGEQDVDDIFSFKGIGTIKNITFGLIIIIISLSLLLSYYFSIKITKPIQELTKNVSKIKKGNLKPEIKATSTDEIGELAKTFNEMRLGLKDRNELLDTILKAFKGKVGGIASILLRKNISELAEKNPRVLKILPKSIGRSFAKEKKWSKQKKKS